MPSQKKFRIANVDSLNEIGRPDIFSGPEPDENFTSDISSLPVIIAKALLLFFGITAAFLYFRAKKQPI